MPYETVCGADAVHGAELRELALSRQSSGRHHVILSVSTILGSYLEAMYRSPIIFIYLFIYF